MPQRKLEYTGTSPHFVDTICGMMRTAGLRVTVCEGACNSGTITFETEDAEAFESAREIADQYPYFKERFKDI